MKFSALFIGSLAGTLAAVLAYVIYDWIDPSFFFFKSPRLILFPLLVAGAQAFFIALPLLLILNRLGRLNFFTAAFCGAISASLPWLVLILASLDSPSHLSVPAWIAAFGAIGGLVGYFTARAVSPNNSFKPTPLRGPA